MTFDIPIALFIYKRPFFVKNQIDILRKLKPTNLYIYADGPKNNSDDQLKCEQARGELSDIDWECDLKIIYHVNNVGLRKNITNGLNNFFTHENFGIILEDDCLPNMDFFYFCQSLLATYSNNQNISVISGNNHQNGLVRGDGSYYFSKFSHCWGWATWARAWRDYDDNIHFWPKWKISASWENLNSSKNEKNYWERIFDSVYDGQIDSWAYRWLATNWYLNRLTVLPNVNLVANFGFGPDSTHTISDIYLPPDPTFELEKIIHPKIIKRDVGADQYTFLYHYGGIYRKFPYILLPIFKRMVPRFIKNKIKVCLIKINLYRFLRLR